MSTNSESRHRVPSARRLPSILWLVAMLVATLAASGGSMQARCPDAKAVQAATAAIPADVAVPGARAEAGRAMAASLPTGLDLEVRIWNVRIGFPWLKSLPVTPGRHIVVSLWEADPDR